MHYIELAPDLQIDLCKAYFMPTHRTPTFSFILSLSYSEEKDWGEAYNATMYVLSTFVL